MKPGTQHEKVEALKAQRQKTLSQLYYVNERGQQQARYSPELQAAKVAEIEKAYDADLQALMESARTTYEEAEAKLTRMERPYDWLTADEMATAAVLAPFIREDISRMDAAGVVQAVKTAAEAGRVEKWLIARYAPQRWQELDATIETSPGMAAKAHYEKSAAELTDAIMPEGRRKERAEAKQQLRDAQDLHDAAEWARPSVREAAAGRWGVDVNYLPD